MGNNLPRVKSQTEYTQDLGNVIYLNIDITVQSAKSPCHLQKCSQFIAGPMSGSTLN